MFPPANRTNDANVRFRLTDLDEEIFVIRASTVDPRYHVFYGQLPLTRSEAADVGYMLDRAVAVRFVYALNLETSGHIKKSLCVVTGRLDVITGGFSLANVMCLVVLWLGCINGGDYESPPFSTLGLNQPESPIMGCLTWLIGSILLFTGARKRRR